MYVLQPTKLPNIISTPLDWTTKYNLNHISIGEVGIKIRKVFSNEGPPGVQIYETQRQIKINLHK
jgi:hypothetical protein